MLKCWFHIDADTLQKRLTDKEADPDYLYQIDWSNTKVLEQFNQVAGTLLKQQDDWVVIDGGDVVIHLFRPEVRSFYNLERMWAFEGSGETGQA